MSDMHAIAIERWNSQHESSVTKWLQENFGPHSKTTWYRDQDWDLFTLVMSDLIYTAYILRWS